MLLFFFISLLSILKCFGTRGTVIIFVCNNNTTKNDDYDSAGERRCGDGYRRA